MSEAEGGGSVNEPFPPGQFTPHNTFSTELEAEVRENLALKGVRLMPFVFSSAVAVVSDVDASTRPRYNGYIGSLVEQYGLDFGDSTWLVWQYMNTQRKSNGFGFFSRYFSTGRKEPSVIFSNTRTLNESVAEYHKGNVDHFHSFTACGPRVSLIDRISSRDNGKIVIELNDIQKKGRWRCNDVFVFGVCVVGVRGSTIDVRAVSIVNRRNNTFSEYKPSQFEAPPNGRNYQLFTFLESAEADLTVPQLDEVARIVVEFEDPSHAAHVERVMLINANGDLLIDRLNILRDRYRVEANLITDHSGHHFRNPPRQKKEDPAMREHIAGYDGPIEAYNGRLNDDDGALIFTTDSDEPFSFCRVFPELSRDLEFRFVVPHAAAKSEGWNPFELVTPSSTRSGGGVYWARRTLPNLREPLPGRKFDDNSRHDTFTSRTLRVLERGGQTPGLFWPIYTHLGGLSQSYLAGAAASSEARKVPHDDFEDEDEDDDEGAPVPSPYFDADAMGILQDHVFNISGKIPRRSRVWFTSATVLYDYALILRNIAGHIERPDGNTIAINSWFDPVLGKSLPRSAAQLYGQTFYVDDCAKARVYLDGRRLEILARNPPDETGRPSVTIAECDIRYVVFDRLNPLANGSDDVTLRSGKWRWSDTDGDETPFGRFTIATSANAAGKERARVVGSMRLPLYGWTPTGAQLLTLSIMHDEDVKFGLLFKTRSGESFYFGDSAVPANLMKGAAACYFFDSRSRAAGRWHTLTVPFHDLVWATNAQPGGAMPNQPMNSVTIFAFGPPGDELNVRGLAFLRPRSIAATVGDAGTFCLGGVIPRFKLGQVAYASCRGSRDREEPWAATVDQRGHFSFGCVPTGIYRVWTVLDGHEFVDRRGPLVEVSSDVVTVILDRREAK